MPYVEPKVRLIINLRDREIVDLLTRQEAKDRFEYLVRLDLEIGFNELQSLTIVSGKHKRYYYQSNHHYKHINY